MQEVKHDGTEGEIRVFNTLDELIVEMKKSLAKPDVAFVKIAMSADGKEFKLREDPGGLGKLMTAEEYLEKKK